MRADVHRGPNDVNHRKLARALAARSTSEAVGPERRQRPSSDLRRSPAPAKDRPSRATRLLASESTPRGDILALQPVHRSRWTACRRGSAAPPTMVLEENVRVSCISLPALLGGKAAWRCFSLCRWQWLKPQVCIQRLSENVLCQRKNRQTLFFSSVLPDGLQADSGMSVGPAGYPAAPAALEQSDPRRGGESPKLPTRVGSPARGPHI